MKESSVFWSVTCASQTIASQRLNIHIVEMLVASCRLRDRAGILRKRLSSARGRRVAATHVRSKRLPLFLVRHVAFVEEGVVREIREGPSRGAWLEGQAQTRRVTVPSTKLTVKMKGFGAGQATYGACGQ